MADDNNPPFNGNGEEALFAGETSFGETEGRGVAAPSLGGFRQEARASLESAGIKLDRFQSDIALMRQFQSSNVQRQLTTSLNQAVRQIRQMQPGEQREGAIAEFNRRTEMLDSVLPRLTGQESVFDAEANTLRSLRQAMGASVDGFDGARGGRGSSRARDVSESDAVLRVLRGQRRLGGEADPAVIERARELVEEERSTAAAELERFQSAEDEQTRDAASRAFNVASNRAAGLENILQYYSEKQSNALEDTLGFISNVMGTLAVGQLTSRFMIQDPFQYDTVPALQAMGQTGDAGAMLSEALMAEAQYDVGLNQTAFGIGAGSMALGTQLALRGNFGGAALAGGFGLVAAAGGLSGNASDFLQNIGIAQDDIVETQLARQVVDAGRLSDLYTSSRAGLLQAGAGPNLGFSGGAQGGNVFLENLVTGRETVSGMTLREMGVSAEEGGRRLSAAAMQLRGRDTALSQAVETTGVMETLFGMDAGTSLGVLSSIQRAGVNPDDYVNTFYQSMGAVSDETGYVSGFAANVLVPALNQVLESTAIQNASRSAEELTREVYGFRQTLAGDDRLGELIDSNPEVFSRIYADMQQTIKQGAQDPSTLGFFRSLGLSYEEIYSGSPEVAVSAINSFRSLLSASGMAMTEESVLPIAATLARSGLGGITDPQVMSQLLLRPEELSIDDLRSAVSGDGEVGGRSEEDLSEGLQETLQLLAEGRDLMDQQIVGAVNVINDMQTIITDFIASDRFDNMILQGIDNIQREFYEQLGVDSTRSALFGQLTNAVAGGNPGSAAY